MVSWAIQLTNERGDSGWFSALSSDGIISSKSKGLAQRFSEEEAAEEVLAQLVERHGLNLEEGLVTMIADDDAAELWLDEIQNSGLVVQRDEANGDYLLIARYGGEECSESLPFDVAEKIAKVLIEAREQLRSKGAK